MVRKTRTLLAGLVAAAALTAAAACRQPLDVGNFSVEGRWIGTTSRVVGTDSVHYTFTLDLKQSRASVTGSGTIKADSGSANTSVSGTWDYPAVTLRMTSPDFADLRLDSQFATRDSLKGPLTGSGFTGTSLTLVRQ